MHVASRRLQVWLTDDEANLEPEGGGGLVVYMTEADLTSGFNSYQTSMLPPKQARAREALLERGKKMTVPYKQARPLVPDAASMCDSSSPSPAPR